MSTDDYINYYGGPEMYNTTILPNGKEFLVHVVYTAREQPGVLVRHNEHARVGLC